MNHFRSVGSAFKNEKSSSFKIRRNLLLVEDPYTRLEPGLLLNQKIRRGFVLMQVNTIWTRLQYPL